jgi:hypothetical protein
MHDFLFRHRSRRFWNKPEDGAPGGTDGPSAVDAQVAPPEVLGAAGPFDDASLEAFVAGVVSGEPDAAPGEPEVDADGNPIEPAPEVDADGNPIEPAPTPTEEEEHAAWLAEQPQEVQDRFAKLAAKAPAKAAVKPEEEVKPKPTAEVKAKVLTPSALDEVDTLDDLQAAIARAETARAWAIENWDGGEIDDGNGGVKPVDAATVRKFFMAQDDLLRKDAPAREQFLRNAEAYLEEAAKAYPYLKNNTTAEYQTVQNVLAFLPELKKRLPDARLFAADWLAGRAARLAKAKPSAGAGTAKPGTAKPKISPSVTTPAPALAERKPASQPNPGAARKPAPSPRQEAAVAAVLKTGGTVEDIATFLKTVG